MPQPASKLPLGADLRALAIAGVAGQSRSC